MGADRRIKVAVLGGGCGSMAAAFELTKTPELRARYEVTVYQQGWRLGGKGASGRNAAFGQRIQEHGLHAFLGFYESAFTLMREAYKEWEKGDDYPFQSWSDAFKAQRQISLQEGVEGDAGAPGRWVPWNVTLPRLPGEPGDGDDLPSVPKMLDALLHVLDDHSKRAHEKVAKLPSATRPVRSDAFAAILTRAREGFEKLESAVAALFEPSLHEASCVLQSIVTAATICTETEPRLLHQLITEARDSVRDAASQVASLDDFWRRLLLVMELGSAIARGIVADVLPAGSFEAIDKYDFKEWLEWHGAPPEVAWSAPTKALYDLGFAYEGGVATRENARAAAGVALRILLSLAFGYKDSPLWKMQAGMGDTVFTPLYEILAKQRGVRFEFFHRVLAIEPSPDGNLVERIELSRQVNLARAYDPLVEVKGLKCWPSEPKWELIDGGAEMARDPDRHDFESAWCLDEVGRKSLEYGRDFDRVVLGISVGALPDVAPKLVAANEDWKEMVAWTKTVATQSMQLWLTPELVGLGWKYGTTVLTSYAEPFDSWGEMSHLVEREDWQPGNEPGSIEYFCGALPDVSPRPPFSDATFPAAQHAAVKANAQAWLDRNTRALWPNVVAAPPRQNGLDWGKLFDARGGGGIARFDAQFFRANIDPTERYVLSVPGSTSKRLAPDDSGFANLYLAGDWTRTTLNGGCAESAIESGMLAARAIAKTRGP
jgi:uncharacterized protein with NAD-binding domain and iron-sulfur cluster